MKRTFSAAAALFTTATTASLMVACDSPIVEIESVRNPLITGSSSTATGVGITSIEIRFRGEQDQDVEPNTSESFVNIGGVGAPTIVGLPDADGNCPDGSSASSDACVTPTDASISAFSCGIYDVRVTGANGMSCEFIANDDEPGEAGTTCTDKFGCNSGYACQNEACTFVGDATGTACTTANDCPAGFSCVEDACAFRYQGDAFYICFLEGRWDLDTHISSGNCGDIF